MSKNIDELIKCYFKQKDIIELKNNKKEKVGNAYLNFFVRRKTTENKPGFNIGILFIVEILIFTLLFYKFLWWILINIVVVIMLIVLYIIELARWKLVSEEYFKIVKNNEIVFKEINKEIATIQSRHKEFDPYDKILQNKILTNEILTFDNAKMFLLNNVKNQTNLIQDYWICDYCGSYNENKSLGCVCCGSNKK